jgi:hypothetical protein
MFDSNLIFIALLLLIIYMVYNKSQSQSQQPILREKFYNIPDTAKHSYWNPDFVGKRALDCYDLNKRDCMKYSNCGLCHKDGEQTCIPGDVQGPLFKEDCQGWQYTNYYDRHIFGEKVVTLTPPWSKFYPDYEARYPSPTSRATL